MSTTPRRAASAAYEAWIGASIAPIAKRHGFTGRGPTFRRREGATWVVFALERRRIDPIEAAVFAGDSQIPFRVHLGVATEATRPAWRPGRSGPPGMYDIAMRAPTFALEPPEGEFWHTFDAADERGQRRLVERLASGLDDALAALGDTTMRSLLELRLAASGPLENLSPGAAEELLALADAAADPTARGRIEEAMRRAPVPDESRPSPDELYEMLQQSFPEANVMIAHRVPEPGSLFPTFRPRRRTAKRRDQLLADLASKRHYPRRQAATLLGGWDGEPAVVEALRAALNHEDDWTRFAAAQSLGQLGDAEDATWRRVLSMTADAAAGPRELGQAILQLSQVRSSDRAEAGRSALAEMAARYPAWTRELLALASKVG